jgi:DNA-binding beta-propeller fold protein YncE
MRIHRRVATGLAALTVAVASLALASGPAQALSSFGLLGQFGAGGNGDGQFSDPAGVAVDQSSGDVDVVDAGNNRVERFGPEGKYLGQFNGGPSHQLATPWSIAVDNSPGAAKGDVYVADGGHNVVEVFDSEGKYLSQLEGTPTGEGGVLEPFGVLEAVAVDPGGNVWVYDQEGHVAEFTAAGSYLARFTTGRGTAHGLAVDASEHVYVLFGCDCLGKYTPTGEQLESSATEPIEGNSLTIDGASHDLYLVGSAAVKQYDSTGSLIREFGQETLEGGEGVAVDSASGKVYVTDASSATVDVFGPQTLPDLITAAVTNLRDTTATLNGTVDPNGLDASFYFEYGSDTGYGSRSPVAGGEDAGAGSTPVPVSVDVSGLRPNTIYHYRLAAHNADGAIAGDDQTFTISAPPVVTTGAVSAVAQTAATVSGVVDPLNIPTVYRVEFGTSAGYGEQVACEAGAGSEGEALTVNLPYLQPGTTYHYRFAATSASGTSYGEDETFTTAGYSLASPPAAALVTTPALAFPPNTAAGTVGSSKARAKSKRKPAHKRAKKTKRKAKPKRVEGTRRK